MGLLDAAKGIAASGPSLNLTGTAKYSVSSLKDSGEYDYFSTPNLVVSVNGKSLMDKKFDFQISDVDVDLSCGYEASVASFSVYGVFDMETSKFETDKLKKWITLGSQCTVSTGYSASVKSIFTGFVSKINFVFQQGNEMPCVRVTCMDVKGIMMANNHSRQLTAKSYGEAVHEIFNQPLYQGMINGKAKIIEHMYISDTPDKQNGSSGGGSGNQKASDRTIEAVCESDYEFVVKAAKKYNFEFYIQSGNVIFRKAKETETVVLDLSPSTGVIKSIDVEYDITGLLGQVEARGMDTGKGKAIVSKQKASNKISLGSKAGKLIKNTSKVYIDPTIKSQEEADARASFLLEDSAYRFGTLECTCVGLPEIVPGTFIRISDIGPAASNTFYIMHVRHTMDTDGVYETVVTAKAACLQ